jgi:hypothetical protein
MGPSSLSTAPPTSSASPPTISVEPTVLPRSQWFGWGGVVLVVAWTVLSGLGSSTDVLAIDGALPFACVALPLLVGLKRWAPPRASSAFVQLGAIALLAWLLTSFASAFSMNWGSDPWLLQVVETFHHGAASLRFGVIALAIALVSRCSRPRELRVLGPLAVVASLQGGHLPVAFIVAGVWWAGRVLRHRASWRWTLAMFLVAILATSPESMGLMCGYGDIWGGVLALPFLVPTMLLYSVPIVVVLVVVGALARRQGKAERAGRLWATAIGFSCFVVGGFALGGCSDVGVGTGPLVVFLFFGPRTRWSTLLWGGASAATAVAASRVFAHSPAHWLAAGSIVVAATVGFALVQHMLLGRMHPNT